MFCFFLHTKKLKIYEDSYLKTKNLRPNVAKYVIKTISKCQIIRHEINQIPPKPKTPFTSQKFKNPKTSLSEDSSNL